MPSLRGVGLEEIARWWFSTAYEQSNATRRRGLPSFRPSIEETLRAACLLVVLMRLQGGRRRRSCVYAIVYAILFDPGALS